MTAFPSASCNSYTAGSETAQLCEDISVIYLFFAGAIVYFMQVGFALQCAGSLRKEKNVKNSMLKSLWNVFAAALGFYFVGYAVAFGKRKSVAEGGPRTQFVGNYEFMLIDSDEDDQDYIYWFFSFAYAAVVPAIMAGTVAERCKMNAYFISSLILTAFVYPVVARSSWSSDGFLSDSNVNNTSNLFKNQGVVDFAGSGVVHLTGGVSALIAGIILGPRKGRYYKKKTGKKVLEPHAVPGHNSGFQVTGTLILWFGFYGFNAGRAIISDEKSDVIGLCAVTTTLSAAAGCISALLIDTIVDMCKSGEVSYDYTMAMNGCLSGLVAISAGCSVVEPWMALIIGLFAGLFYFLFSKLLIYLKIDDTVDAIPVFFANGIWGVLSVGLFADPTLMEKSGFRNYHAGWFYDASSPQLLLLQLIQVVFIIAWVSALMIPVFVLLRVTKQLRVEDHEEEPDSDSSDSDSDDGNNQGGRQGGGGGYYDWSQHQAPPPPIYGTPSTRLPASTNDVYANQQPFPGSNDAIYEQAQTATDRSNRSSLLAEHKKDFNSSPTASSGYSSDGGLSA